MTKRNGKKIGTAAVFVLVVLTDVAVLLAVVAGGIDLTLWPSL